ncbi:hypothetical protein [Streptomyces sp. NPDC001635]
MSRKTTPAGVRVKRRTPFVVIESATARDTKLSYRDLGLLTYLLDQSEDWQVRSEQLSQGEGREGRDAVRKSLHRLASRGYYRLERRRLRNGQTTMGTAISDHPVEQWAADYVTFGQKLDIPVVEQEDGSFRVTYPDGSLGSDGFDPAPAEDTEKPTAEETEDEAAEESKGEEPQAAPKPAAAPRQRKSPEERAAEEEAKQAAADQKAAEKALLDAGAEEVASWWWADAEKHLGKYVGQANGYVAMRKQVRSALSKGYTKRQCADALRIARKHFPSAQQWQHALGVASNHINPGQANGRVSYSDQATWGTQDETPTTTATGSTAAGDDQDDDVSFGVIARA